MTDRLAEHQKKLEDLNDTLEREEDEGYRSVSTTNSARPLPVQTTGQMFFPPSSTDNSISQSHSLSRHPSVGKDKTHYSFVLQYIFPVFTFQVSDTFDLKRYYFLNAKILF